MQEPTNVTSKGELRNFLGTVNQLGNFIPWRAEKDKLLCDLTEKPCRLWEADQAHGFTLASSKQTSPGTGGRAVCVLGFTQSGIC